MINFRQLVQNQLRQQAHDIRAESSGLVQRVTFERRIRNLSPEERQDFFASEAGEMSDDVWHAIESCACPQQKEKIAHDYINAQVFKLRAWHNYLNGVSSNKPFSSAPL